MKPLWKRVYSLVQAVAASLVLAVFFCLGFASASRVSLGFGPTLQGYLSNFLESWESEGADVYRWSRLRSAVNLPILMVGPVRIHIRGSVPGDTSRVEASMDDRRLGETRFVSVPREWVLQDDGGVRPFKLHLRSFSQQGRRGFRAHQLTIVPIEGYLLPSVPVVLNLVAVYLATWALLVFLGSSAMSAHLFSSVALGLPAVALALLDPFAAVHLSLVFLAWLPVATAVVFGLLRLLARRPLKTMLTPGNIRMGCAIFFVTFLFRGGWMMHPDYAYKDTEIHNSITRVGLHRGLADLWRNIERYQAQYDLGTTYVPGGLNVIRYPPTFYTWSLFPNHLQRALSGTYAEDYWNRLLGALASAMQSVPIFLILLSLWPHRGAALFGSILNLFCSIDFHYLAQAAYPATMGKLADLSVIAFAVLAVGVRRYYLGIAILVCSALMTYPASWTNQGLLIGFFCLIELFRREWKDLLRIAAAGLGALVAAHLLFYGDLVLALATVHLPAGLAAGSSLSGFGDLFDLRVWFLSEVLTYFSWLSLVVLLAGFLFYWRSSAFGVPKAWMGAWMASLFGLLLLSHVGGALLMYIRPFFFPAALFGVFGGIALAYLWDDAPLWRRAVVVALFALLLAVELSRIAAIVPGFFDDYSGRMGVGWL